MKGNIIAARAPEDDPDAKLKPKPPRGVLAAGQIVVRAWRSEINEESCATSDEQTLYQFLRTLDQLARATPGVPVAAPAAP